MKTLKFKTPQGTDLPQTRIHLNADALFAEIRKQFSQVKDPRSGNVRISLTDALMSGFAVFSLKDPSLLAFDERRQQGDPNLGTVYGIERAPCDTQMRDILDAVDPSLLRPAFKRVFSQLQRGKALEQMRFLDRYYLLSGDGTGYYYSTKIGNEIFARYRFALIVAKNTATGFRGADLESQGPGGQFCRVGSVTLCLLGD